MKTILKTNIKCGACVAAVTPHLNEAVGEGKWEVDLKNPDRLLTVDGKDASTIAAALAKAGYQGEKI